MKSLFVFSLSFFLILGFSFFISGLSIGIGANQHGLMMSGTLDDYVLATTGHSAKTDSYLGSVDAYRAAKGNWPYVQVVGAAWSADLYVYDWYHAPSIILPDLKIKNNQLPIDLFPIDQFEYSYFMGVRTWASRRMATLWIPLYPFEKQVPGLMSEVKNAPLVLKSQGDYFDYLYFGNIYYEPIADGQFEKWFKEKPYVWTLKKGDGAVICHFDFVKSFTSGEVTVQTSDASYSNLAKYRAEFGPYCDLGVLTAQDMNAIRKFVADVQASGNQNIFNNLVCSSSETTTKSIPSKSSNALPTLSCIEYTFKVSDKVYVSQYDGSGADVAMEILTLGTPAKARHT